MSEPLHVLQIEDSESDAGLILRELKREGYEVHAKRVEDPGALREALATQEWDVIIADYNLPEFNAPAALKILQEVGGDIPFLVVSGAIGEDVAVGLMKAGAHDYLMKNNLPRLAPAVKREMREASHRRQLADQRRALAASEERLRMAVDAAKIGTFEWNVTTDGVYWSPKLESSMGLPAGGFTGTFEAFGRFVHPEDRDRVHRAIRQSMESGSDYEVEFRMIRPDGSMRWALARGRVVFDEAGKPDRMIGIDIDVTEQKRLEELKYQGIIQRQLLEREILAREEERRRIARELHDETGQVLATLLAGLRLIEYAENTQQAKRRAKAISKTVAHTMDIVGRVARGLHPLALEDFGLPAALKNYVAEYSRLHGIEVELTMKGLTAERLPQAFETGLYRVTQEALTNITKHARAHSAKISVRLDKAALILTIADDGCGFDVHRFYRESSGQSLGLHGLKERASMLGGELTVGSRPGKGTRIRFRVNADKVVGPRGRSTVNLF